MAQALRVRLEAGTAEDAVHRLVLTKTLGNLASQEAPLEAHARLIHPLVPVDKGHKGRSGDRRGIHKLSLIATDPSRRAGPNRASDHLGRLG
jgi:hypothetical protein